MDRFIEPLRDRTILEVAAGSGWWTRRLASCNRVIATDYAPEMIARARCIAGPSDTVERCRADAYRLPVADGDVDACFFGFWLSHVPVSRAVEFMREARRVVRPGGDLWLLDSRQSRTSGHHGSKSWGRRSSSNAGTSRTAASLISGRSIGRRSICGFSLAWCAIRSRSPRPSSTSSWRGDACARKASRRRMCPRSGSRRAAPALARPTWIARRPPTCRRRPAARAPARWRDTRR